MITLALLTITLFINYSSAQKYVDLGHEVSPDVPLYPLPGYLNNKFKLSVVANRTTSKGFWIAYNSFCTIEHVSTHIDAPYHFYEKGWTVDEIPLEHFIAPAVVIDVSAQAAEDDLYLISAQDVDNWVSENGVFPNNSVILGRTGWSKKFHDRLAYLGHETDATQLRFPGFGIDSIRRILGYKESHGIHVVGFGIDTISLDHGPSQAYDAHVAVQGENIYIIENMNNLESLPLVGAKIFVMPMKIQTGTGAPTRIFAELPSTEEVIPKSVPVPDIDSPPSESVIPDVISEDTSTNVPAEDVVAVSSASTTTTTIKTTAAQSSSSSSSSSTEASLNENTEDN